MATSMGDRFLASFLVLAGAAALIYGANKAVSAPPSSAPPAAVAKAPAGDALEVDWTTLTSYEYKPGLPNLSEAVKALEGKRIVLGGFLLPLYEYDDIHEFFLVANHMSCCFGIPAGLNGQVYIKVKGTNGLPNTNEPLRITGTFHAKEVKEAGFTLTIWSILDAEVRIVGY